MGDLAAQVRGSRTGTAITQRIVKNGEANSARMNQRPPLRFFSLAA
jgi:hypothetical protein